MTLLGGTFAFPEGAVLALAGSDLGATLEGKPVEMWTPFEAKSKQVLRFGPTRSGARCYLCVRGGVEVQLFLDSASTHILSSLGGYEGRALKKGDVLTIGLTNWNEQKITGKNACSTGGVGTVGKRRLSARTLKVLQPRKVLRVTPGRSEERRVGKGWRRVGWLSG